MKIPTLGYYKIEGAFVQDPTFATEGSACFDLRADFSRGHTISGFRNLDKVQCPIFEKVTYDSNGNANGREYEIFIDGNSDYRWMIPTGLIFDIPDGYHLAVHIRGGTGLKFGLRLANGTGIIDEDYVQETFILIQNLSGYKNLKISHGERIAQARLVKNEVYLMEQVQYVPEQKTSRVGGFNSTGKN